MALELIRGHVVQPANLSAHSIELFAENIARQLGFQPGDDIRGAIEKLGGTVRVIHVLLTDPTSTASLVIKEPSRFDVYLSDHTSLEYDQFRMAHELGHYILHYLWPRHNGVPMPDWMMAPRAHDGRLDQEADRFAAAFLMPKAAFSAAWSAAQSPFLVAERFRVSSRASQNRAMALKLAA